MTYRLRYNKRIGASGGRMWNHRIARELREKQKLKG
jgi:hypothetical protein